MPGKHPLSFPSLANTTGVFLQHRWLATAARPSPSPPPLPSGVGHRALSKSDSTRQHPPHVPQSPHTPPVVGCGLAGSSSLALWGRRGDHKRCALADPAGWQRSAGRDLDIVTAAEARGGKHATHTAHTAHKNAKTARNSCGSTQERRENGAGVDHMGPAGHGSMAPRAHVGLTWT